MSQEHPSTTPPRAGDAGILARAAAHVAAGGLLILPTDTVYGIGCAAPDAPAVARLLAAKGRGRQMPPPVLVAGPDQLDGVVRQVPPVARTLLDAFWPGALTLILPAATDLGWDLGETGGTLAVRMPDHPLTLELLAMTGPMAVTSANHTGEPPATDADTARAAFPGRIGTGQEDIHLLDGGSTPGPVPSTIVSLVGADQDSLRFLRDGALSRTQVLSALGLESPASNGSGTAPEVGRTQANGPGRVTGAVGSRTGEAPVDEPGAADSGAALETCETQASDLARAVGPGDAA